MAKIKFGVIGTIRGITFIELLQVMGDKACLHAVCENNPELLEKAKKEHKDKIGDGYICGISKDLKPIMQAVEN